MGIIEWGLGVRGVVWGGVWGEGVVGVGIGGGDLLGGGWVGWLVYERVVVIVMEVFVGGKDVVFGG